MTATFFHHDIVTLKKVVPGLDVPVGTEGTVIRVFGWMNPVVYDVIFHDADGKSLGAFHGYGDEALVLERSPLGHFRKQR